MKIKTQSDKDLAPSFAFERTHGGDGTVYATESIGQLTYEKEVPTVSRYRFSQYLGDSPYAVENLTPLVCDISEWPTVSQVENGIGRIKVSNQYTSKIATLSFTDATNSSVFFVTSPVADTFNNFAWGLIKSAMDGSSDLSLFTSGDSNTPSGVYNEDCWAHQWDFSGVMSGVWSNGQWRAFRAGTLITNQHMWNAWHYPHAVGSLIRFSDKAGNHHTRTIVGRHEDSPSAPRLQFATNPVIGDYQVYTLSAPLPPEVEVYPLVDLGLNKFGITEITPDSPVTYYANDSEGMVSGRKSTFYCQEHQIWVDQNRQVRFGGVNYPQVFQARVRDVTLSAFGISFSPQDRLKQWYGSLNTQTILDEESRTIYAGYENFQSMARGGDSGCPMFVPVSSSKLAIKGTFTMPNGGMLSNQKVLNMLISASDADALSRNPSFNGGEPTGLTVTVATDPTL
jgi:hypothetical protein